jgi:aspartate/methionine/tyrosine aminotransferase
VFRLTGHRVGAMIAGEARLAEAEKFLDTVTICPPRIGQIAALHGLEHLSGWVAEEREAVLSRRAALEAVMASDLPDWRLKGAGAYFAYVEPPFDIPSDALARRLLAEQGVLLLPGTMFVPAEGDWGGERHLRIAFANADGTGLAEMGARLAAFAP